MDHVPGARAFATTGAAYDAFMGRYSRRLAGPFAVAAGVAAGLRALDVGCGPGALTGELVGRLGVGAVRACDPSPQFVAACAERFPGVDIRAGRAEAIPFADDCVDVALAQLVLHFVSDPPAAATELRRVVRPGGVVAACVWDFADGMEMLRHFWDAALTIDGAAPDEARVLRYGGPGEIAALFRGAGLTEVGETTMQVATTYESFDELWSGFLQGIGPAGSYCVALDDTPRALLRAEFSRRCGSPEGAFSLGAVARMARGTVPV